MKLMLITSIFSLHCAHAFNCWEMHFTTRMHSSRMLPSAAEAMCIPACTGRGCIPTCTGQGGVCPGVVCPGGHLARGCVTRGRLPGGCLPQCMLGYTPREHNDWQTGVKTLPCRNLTTLRPVTRQANLTKFKRQTQKKPKWNTKRREMFM